MKTDKLTKAIVRPPGSTFAHGLTTAKLGVPDPALALAQHREYCAALEKCGLELFYLEADDEFPDSTFIEDTAIVTQRCAVVTRPGASSRRGEVMSTKRILSTFYETLESINEPGTLDAGDVCQADNHFFIGISKRTNEVGAWQLAKVLAIHGYTSAVIDIRQIDGLLHLKSGLAFIGDNRLVVVDSLRRLDELRNYDIVHVDDEDAYAANCIRINTSILVASGYPRLEQSLHDLGYETLALQMSEFKKMDGGLSCLSLRV